MAEDKDFYAYDELSDTAKECARRSLADYRASHGWYADTPGTDDWKSFAEAFNDIGYDARVDSYGNVDLEFKGRSSDSGADDGPVSSDWYYDDELTNEALEPGFRDYVIDLTYLPDGIKDDDFILDGVRQAYERATADFGRRRDEAMDRIEELIRAGDGREAADLMRKVVDSMNQRLGSALYDEACDLAKEIDEDTDPYSDWHLSDEFVRGECEDGNYLFDKDGNLD